MLYTTCSECNKEINQDEIYHCDCCNKEICFSCYIDGNGSCEECFEEE